MSIEQRVYSSTLWRSIKARMIRKKIPISRMLEIRGALVEATRVMGPGPVLGCRKSRVNLNETDVDAAFTWANSPQGGDFWASVNDQVGYESDET